MTNSLIFLNCMHDVTRVFAILHAFKIHMYTTGLYLGLKDYGRITKNTK